LAQDNNLRAGIVYASSGVSLKFCFRARRIFCIRPHRIFRIFCVRNTRLQERQKNEIPLWMNVDRNGRIVDAASSGRFSTPA